MNFPTALLFSNTRCASAACASGSTAVTSMSTASLITSSAARSSPSRSSCGVSGAETLSATSTSCEVDQSALRSASFDHVESRYGDVGGRTHMGYCSAVLATLENDPSNGFYRLFGRLGAGGGWRVSTHSS